MEVYIQGAVAVWTQQMYKVLGIEMPKIKTHEGVDKSKVNSFVKCKS